MNKRCDDIREGLVELAHGKESADASEHLISCADCRQLLNEFTALAAALRHPSKTPPLSASAAAKGLMPAPSRRLARLVPVTFSTTRHVGPSTLSFECEEFKVRVQLVRIANETSVLGKVEGFQGVVSTESDSSVIANDGRFEVSLADSEDRSLEFLRTGEVIVVPLEAFFDAESS
ncbi:MAG TPA: hypothetical protein PKA27_06440 [Fimbriimonadaceae bacterium]|nr:hypothetical protein [Fimbriimonadaceae bacterium]